MERRLTNRNNKSGPPRFDVPALRAVAGQKVFARGVEYHVDEQVEIVTIDEARVLANVSGSEIYRSELTGRGKKFTGACSCPAFSDWGFCKHLVAVALTVNDLPPGAVAQATRRLTNIREHLRSNGVEQLVDMIMNLAERDPALRKDLELAAATDSADDGALFTQFKKAITEVTRTHGFVEYREAHSWALGIESVLDRLEKLVGDRPQLVLRLLDYFFTRMDEALNAMDDSDGHGGGVYARACEIHVEACRGARPDPVKLARDLFAREVEGGWDFFHGASKTYADVLGEAGLAEYRRLANGAWQKIKPLAAGGRQVNDDQFSERLRLGGILAHFAEVDGDVDAGIAIRAKDLSTAYDYLTIAQYCLDHARKVDAVKWAEEGLWQFEDRPDQRLVVFAVDLYRRLGRCSDSDALLWRAFERGPSIELYRRLKKAAGRGRAATEAARDRAFALLRAQIAKPAEQSSARWPSPAELLVRLMLEEGLLTQAWEVVAAHGCSVPLLASLAEASEVSHPAEALKVHGDRVELLVSLGGQSNYESACKIIERMRCVRERLGENKGHATYLCELMSRHKAKRNFMKLLNAR